MRKRPSRGSTTGICLNIESALAAESILGGCWPRNQLYRTGHPLVEGRAFQFAFLHTDFDHVGDSPTISISISIPASVSAITTPSRRLRRTSMASQAAETVGGIARSPKADFEASLSNFC
jgi:hypothetical protein